jgi:hypothetical protein
VKYFGDESGLQVIDDGRYYAASQQDCRMIGRSIIALLIIVTSAWAWLAIMYQTKDVVRGLLLACLVVLVVGSIVMTFWSRSLWPVAPYVVAFGALILWWQTIAPSNHRDWAADVARQPHATVNGSVVTIDNVRDFRWRSDTDFDERWDKRTYDLDQLTSTDIVFSYWGMPAIAHTMISFGFSDGSHVVFSVEVRRERTEAWSEIGGFFREFELIVIAADERDIIAVRTNVRGEDDYIYRLALPQATARSLFLAYIAEANQLLDTPRFYNTLTSNCTTQIYTMARHIVGDLPMDYRLLVTGYLPSYLYQRKGLNRRFTQEELRESGRITDRARHSGTSDTFSADIRLGVPAAR